MKPAIVLFVLLVGSSGLACATEAASRTDRYKRPEAPWVQRSDGTLKEGVWRIAVSASDLQGDTQWRVSGHNAQVGTLSGTAALRFSGSTVTGQIQGEYVTTSYGARQAFDVLNNVQGTALERTLRLRWRNPMDGSSGTMTLERRGDSFEGSWTTDDGSDHGTIQLVRAEGGPSQLRESPPERAAKRRKAEELLREAVNSGTSQEAVQKARAAAALFREVGDTNKVGYALYEQGIHELNLNRYADATERFDEILRLGDDVEPTIRELAQSGKEMAAIKKSVDQRSR